MGKGSDYGFLSGASTWILALIVVLCVIIIAAVLYMRTSVCTRLGPGRAKNSGDVELQAAAATAASSSQKPARQGPSVVAQA
ncbi:hypothetical protein BCR44DRAFT_37405 [Catenaria anguillulae PL171]|uniref:Uncharacterized protein n=1 Tax=Catenaria anguillulae PL171 TaxID=765915 RepID=A0A1Y2HRF7_9FUNG|nr:hypothetical protein BCR44DRAFT_37405 [Catenaria anguillulae PL171]